MSTLILGHLVHLTGRPALTRADEALEDISDGALLVDDAGRIVWKGCRQQAPDAGPDTRRVDYGAAWVLPGFIDTHLHFGQLDAADCAGGGQLLAWLEHCIFPAEARLRDGAVAAHAARAFCRRLIRAGTTTAMVMGSPFPEAQEQLFRSFDAAGLRGVIGRGIQTVGPAAARPLITSEDDALRLTEAELLRHHPTTPAEQARSRLQVAIMPRFSLSVTPATLAGLGELFDSWRPRGAYFSTHLSENNLPGDGEVASVLRRYRVRCYLDTYDGRFLPGSRKGGHSLLSRRSVFAHAVHCSDDERHRLAETGSSIAHCPVSQLFLGSGTMPWRRTLASGVNLAAGSDLAAGDSWFLPEVLNACYKTHISEAGTDSVALSAAQLLHLATVAGARALDMESRIGNLDPGREADLVVLDPARRESLAASLARHERGDGDGTAALFTLLMAAREENVVATWVAGRRLDPDLPGSP